MDLKSQMETDARTVFANTDDFAETVTYVPHQYYGEATPDNRSISAVVEREEITQISADEGETVSPVWIVHVQNDSTYGISSSELDLGGDKISFPPRLGETAKSKSVVRLISQDVGMLVLECR